MKELSIEEKAKRYDEAIERAREYWETDNDNTLDIKAKGTMEYLFPELKESEDERIRKAIKLMYSFLPNKPKYIGDVSVEDMFAWLEKQGEQKSVAKYKVGDTVYYDSFGRLVSFVIANIVEDGTDNPMYEDKDGNSVFQNDIVEHKPADKVEPRFKVGDWITNGIDVCKIKNIDLNEFNYIFENGISDISLVDNICHLWTIQDAKDGDVLAADPIKGYGRRVSYDRQGY